MDPRWKIVSVGVNVTPVVDHKIKFFNSQSQLLRTLEKKAFENVVGKGENSIFSFSYNVC